MNKNIFILIICFFLLWACAGPFYYDLHINPAKNNHLKKINKILRVENIETNQTFFHQQIAYRKSPYQVQYFPFMQWAKSPRELIKDSIIYFYRTSSFFNRVISTHSSLEADIIMRVIIDSLEIFYQDKQWYAHLALDIEMADIKTEKIFLTHTFDKKMKIKGKKAKYAPEKISTILKEELLTIVKKLQK